MELLAKRENLGRISRYLKAEQFFTTVYLLSTHKHVLERNVADHTINGAVVKSADIKRAPSIVFVSTKKQ